jgi:uncharacterized protein (TIGR02117 family)
MERNSGVRKRRSTSTAGLAAIILVLGLLFGCAAPGNLPYTGQNPTRPVWLVAPGWHTGLAVRRTDIPPDLLPERADFPEADYLEVGWGDRDYYPASDPGVWLALKAALIPGPSILHVAGLGAPPDLYSDSDKILRIELPETAFRNLIVYLHDSFARHGSPRALPLGPGLYGNSRFYEARGRFHVFNNCNTWAARALHAAGLPVAPFPVITAGNLRCQVRHWRTLESSGAKNGGVRSDTNFSAR